MKEIFENTTKGFESLSEKYSDWISRLPTIFGVLVIIGTVFFPMMTCVYGIEIAVDRHEKNVCLESVLPRRYHSFVCEEYKDGQWIKVDPSEKTYHYNSKASEVGND